MKDQVQIKKWESEVGVRTPKTKYYAEVIHSGLNDHKIFSADEEDILDNKISTHIAKIEEKWEKIKIKNNIAQYQIASQKEAEVRTQTAIQALKDIDNILHHTLGINDAIDWETLKDRTKFKEANPETSLARRLAELAVPTYPKQPNESDFQPNISFFDKIIKSNKEKKILQAKESYNEAIRVWKEKCLTIDKEIEAIEVKKEQIRLRVASEVTEWEIRKQIFYSNQVNKNLKVDELKAKYMSCDQSAVSEYCELVLVNSEYPDSFPKTFEIEYNPENRILIIEYSLPTLEDLPTLNEVKLIKNDFKEYHISDTQLQKMYDITVYRITLRTIHEIFEADKANAIDLVSFNGWVNTINRATGRRENNCILSIQANKNEFLEIDLAHVDPKTCFKNLKGVGSSKLSGLTPIQPILKINKSDKRFVNHYEVVGSLDSSTNLASMDWEDFEHLIREVFASEFSGNGGEVKVTQASKDGGVDAVAFDPDPIRGGKIVIQAKRYTNSVGVSAVRDLYGTVMNEGATKGILVTTADYGPDAYEFAKGKPITLMNGANLLYLLEKHGHKARIDIREAKNEMKSK
jgi:restriction system protein